MHYKLFLIVLSFLFLSCSVEKNSSDYKIRIDHNYYDINAIDLAYNPSSAHSQKDSLATLTKWVNRELLYIEALTKNLDKDIHIL